MSRTTEDGKKRFEKLNCREVMGCGREIGCQNAYSAGVCPAASDPTYDGINSGRYAGRVCWAVEGTLCGGCVQGSFTERRFACTACDFYQMVREEERRPGPRTKFLQFVKRLDRSPFFDKMTRCRIEPGQRFVVQGAVEDRAYIIERGSCLVIVEREGVLHPVDHYGEGDIVGGLGILTGEPRRAHVEAETEMSVWIMTREHCTTWLPSRYPGTPWTSEPIFTPWESWPSRWFSAADPSGNRCLRASSRAYGERCSGSLADPPTRRVRTHAAVYPAVRPA